MYDSGCSLCSVATMRSTANWFQLRTELALWLAEGGCADSGTVIPRLSPATHAAATASLAVRRPTVGIHAPVIKASEVVLGQRASRRLRQRRKPCVRPPRGRAGFASRSVAVLRRPRDAATSSLQSPAAHAGRGAQPRQPLFVANAGQTITYVRRLEGDAGLALVALEVDGAVGAQLRQPVLAADRADRAALRPHDQRLGRRAAGAVAHAVEQLAVGDAGRD